MKMAFVVKNKSEKEKVISQLSAMHGAGAVHSIIDDVQDGHILVCESFIECTGWYVETNVIPDKEDALILDFAENIDRHNLKDDIFTPEIKNKAIAGESVPIQVECPACHCITQKKRRNDPIYDGVAHDRFGNFIVPGTERATRFVDGEAVEWDGEIMTMKIQDPSRKDEFGEIEEIDLPMPAHYSRRCSNPEAYVVKGVAVACGHRFSLKICPECYAENDIAARHCTECKGRLVDPNSKLTDDADLPL